MERKPDEFSANQRNFFQSLRRRWRLIPSVNRRELWTEMPRYFFHFVWGNDAARDTEGVELEGLRAAYLHALEMLHRVHVNFPEAGDDWVIEISDEAGRKPLVVLPGERSSVRTPTAERLG
jgi:hypothetical protein